MNICQLETEVFQGDTGTDRQTFRSL